MTLGAYNTLRGWDMPSDEDPEKEGYIVEYPLVGDEKPNVEGHEGYVSWSPKAPFEATYRLNGSLTFGDAVAALKAGKRVRRSGWNGNGMWVFKQVPAEVPQDIIPKMQSVPESAKAAFIERGTPLKYDNQLALVTVSGDINGWTPSVSDALAEDWEVL